MFGKIFLALVFIFLIAPVLTAFHELGHSAIPTLNGEEVEVSIGQNTVVSFQIKNIKIKFGLLKPWIGYASWSAESTVLQLLMGPIVSLMLGAGFYILSSRAGEFKGLLLACAGWCLFQFLFTMIPMNYPTFLGYGSDQQSDGKQVLQLLQNSHNARE